MMDDEAKMMDEGEIETVSVWLCAAGHRAKRIAQTIGKSESYVRSLMLQKSFRERVLAILKERGLDGTGRFDSGVTFIHSGVTFIRVK